MTSGGGSDTACTNIENGTFGAELSYDVPKQGADMNAGMRALIENKPKPGAEHVTQFTPIKVLEGRHGPKFLLVAQADPSRTLGCRRRPSRTPRSTDVAECDQVQ